MDLLQHVLKSWKALLTLVYLYTSTVGEIWIFFGGGGILVGNILDTLPTCSILPVLHFVPSVYCFAIRMVLQG